MRLEGHGAGGVMTMHEVQAGSPVQQQSIKSTIIAMELGVVLFHSSNDTKRSETMCAVFNWAFLVIELFKSGAQWYAKKVVEQHI